MMVGQMKRLKEPKCEDAWFREVVSAPALNKMLLQGRAKLGLSTVGNCCSCVKAQRQPRTARTTMSVLCCRLAAIGAKGMLRDAKSQDIAMTVISQGVRVLGRDGYRKTAELRRIVG